MLGKRHEGRLATLIHVEMAHAENGKEGGNKRKH